MDYLGSNELAEHLQSLFREQIVSLAKTANRLVPVRKLLILRLICRHSVPLEDVYNMKIVDLDSLPLDEEELACAKELKGSFEYICQSKRGSTPMKWSTVVETFTVAAKEIGVRKSKLHEALLGALTPDHEVVMFELEVSSEEDGELYDPSFVEEDCEDIIVSSKHNLYEGSDDGVDFDHEYLEYLDSRRDRKSKLITFDPSYVSEEDVTYTDSSFMESDSDDHFDMDSSEEL